MNERFKIITLLIFIIAAVPCNIVLASEVTEADMCMAIDPVTKEAKGVSTEFLTTTPEIIIRITLSGASPGEMLQFAWYTSGDALYDFETVIVTSETVYWASLSVEGTSVEAYDSIWTVRVYHGVDVDNLEEKTSKSFKIVDYNQVIDAYAVILDQYAEQISDLSDENSGLIDQINSIAPQVTSLQSQVTSLTGQLIALEADYIIVNSDLQSVQNEYASLNSTYYEALADLEEAKESLNQAQQSQGPSTTLFYIAIAAAVIGILAAAYFAMKARGSM